MRSDRETLVQQFVVAAGQLENKGLERSFVFITWHSVIADIKDYEGLKDRARAIKEEATIENLPELLTKL